MNNSTVAIMQPYFYPYIGYFHLINSVDKFVIFDDVNFIKKGWINRNQILLNGNTHLFTIPIREMSQNKKINESFIHEPLPAKLKITNLLVDAYKKAPFFNENIEVLLSLINSVQENIALYNMENLKGLCAYLNIKTIFEMSSRIPHSLELKGQERIISLVKSLGADTYINAIGGQKLYNNEVFVAEKIKLEFIKSFPISYDQGIADFIPNLSIIDVLMYAGKDRTSEMIQSFECS